MLFRNENDLHVDRSTKRRFAEIELFFIYDELIPSLSYDRAFGFLVDFLQVPYNMRDDMKEFISFKPNRPTKREVVYYYRANNISYERIKRLHGISPITVSKYVKEFHESGIGLVPKKMGLHDDEYLTQKMAFIRQTFQNIASQFAN